MLALWLLVTAALTIVIQSNPAEGSGTVLFRLANLSESIQGGAKHSSRNKFFSSNATVCACLRRKSELDGSYVKCTTELPGLGTIIINHRDLARPSQVYAIPFHGDTEHLKLRLEIYLPLNSQPMKHSVLLSGSSGHWSSWSLLQAGGAIYHTIGQLQLRWRIRCNQPTPCPDGICSALRCDNRPSVPNTKTDAQTESFRMYNKAATSLTRPTRSSTHAVSDMLDNSIFGGVCNSSRRGDLSYSKLDNALFFCNGEQWVCANRGSCQAVTISEGQDLKPPRRKKYRENPNVVSDFQTFRDGSKDYIIACHGHESVQNSSASYSYVYKRNPQTGFFEVKQYIKKVGFVLSCRLFRQNGKTYLTMLNLHPARSNEPGLLQPQELVTLTWSPRKEKFRRKRKTHRLPHPHGYNFDLFDIHGVTHLAVVGKAVHSAPGSGVNHEVSGTWIAIYYWEDHGTKNMSDDSFEIIYDVDHRQLHDYIHRDYVDRSLRITGITASITHFRLAPFDFLALALSYDEAKGTTKLNSPIFKLKVSHKRRRHTAELELIQLLPTNGAFHWEKFTIDASTFLAVANRQQFNMHNSEVKNDQSSHVDFTLNSTIFKYSFERMEFVPFQNILLTEANHWHHFSICGDHFIAAGFHSGSDQALNEPGKRLHNPYGIYIWRGVEKFIPWYKPGPENSKTKQWKHLQIGRKHYLLQNLEMATRKPVQAQSRLLQVDISYCGCQERY